MSGFRVPLFVLLLIIWMLWSSTNLAQHPSLNKFRVTMRMIRTICILNTRRPNPLGSRTPMSQRLGTMWFKFGHSSHTTYTLNGNGWRIIGRQTIINSNDDGNAVAWYRSSTNTIYNIVRTMWLHNTARINMQSSWAVSVDSGESSQ